MIPPDPHAIEICDVARRMPPRFRDSARSPAPLTSVPWASARSSKDTRVLWMITSRYRCPLKASPMGFGSNGEAANFANALRKPTPQHYVKLGRVLW